MWLAGFLLSQPKLNTKFGWGVYRSAIASADCFDWYYRLSDYRIFT